jgi:ubiquinone/menaquinone biosynthesis C-methylase UbiE
MVLLLGFGALLALALLIYWLLIVGELTYFGPSAVRLVYHFGAPHYDDVRHAMVGHDVEVLAPLLLPIAERYSPAMVLDVASGTGRVPLLLAASPGFQGMLVGLDLTPAMLERARAKQQKLGYHNISWQIGRAERLPWPGDSFDLVTCLEALEFFGQPQRALAEMARVLRPGGTLVVSKYPDRWARLLPGRGMSSERFRLRLTELGLHDIRERPWQPGHYELVIASKPVPCVSTMGDELCNAYPKPKAER